MVGSSSGPACLAQQQSSYWQQTNTGISSAQLLSQLSKCQEALDMIGSASGCVRPAQYQSSYHLQQQHHHEQQHQLSVLAQATEQLLAGVDDVWQLFRTVISAQ